MQDVQQGASNDKRLSILRAALTEFGHSGFHAASMRNIAQLAGVAKGTVYLYFRDKDELFTKALIYGWEVFFGETAGIVEGGGSPMSRIEALIDKGFKELKTAYPLLRGMFFESARRELLESNVNRLCAAIDRSVSDTVDPEAPRRGGLGSTGLGVVKLIVSGILFDVAICSQANLEAELGRLSSTLKEALGQGLFKGRSA